MLGVALAIPARIVMPCTPYRANVVEHRRLRSPGISVPKPGAMIGLPGGDRPMAPISDPADQQPGQRDRGGDDARDKETLPTIPRLRRPAAGRRHGHAFGRLGQP